MSLYGALFGGVAGLNAQSSKIGIISDNIANVNTIGYKQGEATFSTLVVNANSSVAYNTGGVRAGTRLDISKQGTLQSTESATDLAISGSGFFIVKSVANAASGSSQDTPLYTRAGSFTQDSLGNFINSQGFYLQGWPLDREGRLPGEPGNLDTTSSNNFDSLTTVNVQSASGVAQATTSISVGANLDAGETVYAGESGLLKPDSLTTVNQNQPATSILVGAEYGMASTDSLHRGDQFTVSTGNGLQYTYEYGGYAIGRDVGATGGGANYGDLGYNNTQSVDLSVAGSVKVGTTAATFVVHIPNNGLIDGDKITLSGFSAIGLTTAAELNGVHTVTRLNANDLLITVTNNSGIAANTNVSAAGQLGNIRQYGGNILDAASPTQSFLNKIGTSGFTPAALTLTVTTPTTGVKTFTYTSSAPNTLNGQFNNLTTLAAAIDSTTGLTARVVNGRLTVGSEDASEAVSFGNGDASGSATQRGIDWVTELDLQNVASGTRRYSSMQSLANIVNTDSGVSATVSNPLASSTLTIQVNDPLDTIQFKDLTTAPFSVPAGSNVVLPAGTFVAGSTISATINDSSQPSSLVVGSLVYFSGLTAGTGGLPAALPNGGPFVVTAKTGTSYTVSMTAIQDVTLAGGTYNAPAGNSASIQGVSNQGSPLAALGLVDTLNGLPYTTPQTTAVLGPKYDPTGTVGKNMASGEITAQFSRNVRVYDSLGTGHDITFSFIKTATNTWAVEVHVTPKADVSTTLVDGQIATGNITFNGDGTLRSVSAALNDPITINWTNGSVSSGISLGLGTAGEPFGTVGAATIGLSDGLSQFDSSYNVNFANQNGAPVGQLVSVAINTEGVVIASYSNGQTQDLFKLPLASFANPDGLTALTGNVFAQSRESGEVNLRESGSNGTGSVRAASLEQSNVDLATQLTDMIVAQRSYQANTRVIKTTDELLDQLNQI